MSGSPFVCGMISIFAILAAWQTSGDKAFGFWLLALFALIGAANS